MPTTPEKIHRKPNLMKAQQTDLQLALSTEMLNLRTRKNVVGAVNKTITQRIKAFGRRLGIHRGNRTDVNAHLFREQVSLQYENGTLDLDLMVNRRTGDEAVGSFGLRLS